MNQDIDVDQIFARLSCERLKKYLERVKGDRAVALRLYLWNNRVAAAINAPLSQFEICLRNSISLALTDKSVADGHGPNWHTYRRLKHHNQDVSNYFETTREKARGNRNGFDPALPDFIAASTFNLWREFCKPSYAGVFWAKRILISFPHISIKSDARTALPEIHHRVDLLLKLRNRIAHHEPLIGARYEKPCAKLLERHKEMAEMLEWMDPNFARWVASFDEFLQIMDTCPIP